MLSPMMESLAHECVLLVKTPVSDGEGGWTNGWADGPTFKTYPAIDSSIQARRAEKEGVTSLYSVMVPQNVPISLGDFYRDTVTDETFHVTSNPDEKKTPETSTLGVKGFTAEKKALPL